jgi:hypothetical protein
MVTGKVTGKRCMQCKRFNQVNLHPIVVNLKIVNKACLMCSRYMGEHKQEANEDQAPICSESRAAFLHFKLQRVLRSDLLCLIAQRNLGFNFDFDIYSQISKWIHASGNY